MLNSWLTSLRYSRTQRFNGPLWYKQTADFASWLSRPWSWRVVLLHFSSSINESGHWRIAAATRVMAWRCGAITSVAAAILPMGCRVDWTSKGQQNNKPMIARRKLIPKWKNQYTSQLFTFPSYLVGNFILVFKFLTNAHCNKMPQKHDYTFLGKSIFIKNRHNYGPIINDCCTITV